MPALPAALAAAPTTTHYVGDREPTLQCLEVWGGNDPADRGVAMPGLDAWVFSLPYEQADQGGDVYYMSSCATGRITRMLVADVSGHGSEVAKTSDALRALMRRHVNQISQTRFVRALNREFAALADEGRFATAVAASYFAPTRTLTLANAGHPPPAIYRADENRWSLLEPESSARSAAAGPANVPLGILDLTDYDQRVVRLEPGDLVLCYTDSLIESRAADGAMLGTRGLIRTLSILDPREPAMFIERLLMAIAAEHRGNLAHDDVTAMLFTPNGRRATPTIRKRLEANWAMLKRLIGSMLPGGEPMPWPDAPLANIGGFFANWFNRFGGPRMRG